MAPSSDVQAAVKNACDLLGGIVKSITNRINSEQLRLTALTEQLRTLEGQPNPDSDQIAQIKQLMTTLRGQVDQDEADLASSRADFDSFCVTK